MKDTRQYFPILQQGTYLNTARFCALPNQVAQIQAQFLEHLNTHGSWSFDDWTTRYEETRRMASALIDNNPSNLFFLPNVSTGFNLCAQYLPKRKVICLKNDFPTVNMSWGPHAFDVEMLDHRSSDFQQELKEVLTGEPCIVAMSWIQSADGFELDLPLVYDLSKKHGHWLVLDATQGLGCLSLPYDTDVQTIIFSSGFKWLLAGYGVAVGHVHPSLQAHFEPMRGWFSIDYRGGGMKKGMASLEVGNANYLMVFALHEGLKLLDTVGLKNIEEHNLSLNKRLLEGLEERVLFPESRSSIKSIMADERLVTKIKKDGIQITEQKGRIRTSNNFYNDSSEIDLLRSILLS